MDCPVVIRDRLNAIGSEGGNASTTSVGVSDSKKRSEAARGAT